MREALWMQNFEFCISSPYEDVRNKVVFLILEHSSLRMWGGELNKKTHKKKHQILAFKPLLQEITLKNPTIRKIFLSSNVLSFEIKKKYMLPKLGS